MGGFIKLFKFSESLLMFCLSKRFLSTIFKLVHTEASREKQCLEPTMPFTFEELSFSL